ncbi:MAG: alpha-L-fucosidase, partial [Planctomycetota bacterium]|nr:alpha-L-fucosidase [Planctomycetota bacterium]
APYNAIPYDRAKILARFNERNQDGTFNAVKELNTQTGEIPGWDWEAGKTTKRAMPDDVRAKQLTDLRFGMFICWSFSTFGGQEYVRGITDPKFFRATGCDTDQWCEVARSAGMKYILFLTKHHDGFCLWDTRTTEFKVTNTKLGVDVLAQLKRSCDKYGLKLALYFSEGDWHWGARTGWGRRAGRAAMANLKKAQLQELCTQYGPIEFFWMDHHAGDGGVSHVVTTKWVHQFQPDCFVGYNHGQVSGRYMAGEVGKPGKLEDSAGAARLKRVAARKMIAEQLGPRSAENKQEFDRRVRELVPTLKWEDVEENDLLLSEFTYPILPTNHRGGAKWFYSLPKHDNLCHSAEKLYRDYVGACKFNNLFSLNVGPDYKGKIRAIDAKTLEQVGNWIRAGTRDQR